MSRTVRFSYQDLRLFGDDKRRELLDGEIHVTPAPNIRHQRIVTKLISILDAFLREHPLGEALVAPVDVILSEEDDDVVEPDILYISKERASLVSERGIQGAPDWVVEVVSPSTRKRDFILKQKLYQRYGVRLYWVIDPEAEMLHVWEGKAHRVYDIEATVEVALLPGFSLVVQDILV